MSARKIPASREKWTWIYGVKYKFSIKLCKVNGRFSESLEDLTSRRDVGRDRFLQEAHNVDYFRSGYGDDRDDFDAGDVRRELKTGPIRGQILGKLNLSSGGSL
jgi:hypothetical protein